MSDYRNKRFVPLAPRVCLFSIFVTEIFPLYVSRIGQFLLRLATKQRIRKRYFLAFSSFIVFLHIWDGCFPLAPFFFLLNFISPCVLYS